MQSRSSSADTLRGTPVPHGEHALVMHAANEGSRRYGTGQPMESHAVAIREPPWSRGACGEPRVLTADEGFDDSRSKQPIDPRMATHSEPPLPRGASSAPGGLHAPDEGLEDFGTHVGQPAARHPYVHSYTHTEMTVALSQSCKWSESMVSKVS